ncbi:tetratricopeptide repeat protein [Paracidobacterium acidisoli]|uniref:tetratricopeptide repeat protein n=1 Tax=Paracidobacterium acidisoli TaxID=2303751 RepID=UPI0011C0CBBA|nr:tetratricopeptide repeat protein [Paracidobacterium acidisoli]MBT9329463.1 tetratricopeptide repeat protein [Paracidobacterium acidisoli]
MRRSILHIVLLLLLCSACGYAQQSRQSDSSQSSSNANGDTNAPQKQTQPANQTQDQHKKHSAAEDNPFPEAQSTKAAHEAGNDTPAPDSSSPATPPSSSDKNYSSSQDGLKGLDLPGDKDSRISDGAGGTVLNPKLAADDARVGGYYLRTGDYKGAYSRYLEATKVDPGNADAVFGLAEAERGLNHRDEAVSGYRLYLEALPDGPHAKDARKALKALGAKPPE